MIPPATPILPATPRLRFAPSPTGYLHVGGARTALFNWLYARKTGGAFLLRIEDTDRERSSDEHTRVILDGLTWLGLAWDEDVVFQGARVERHREVADRLVAEGHAYLDEGAVRLRMPRDEIAWDDFVHGRVSFQGADIKDWVILRSDRTPTYNFVVVVDDMDMRITHVMRGDDHVSNTPKQIAVYRALGAPLPRFGHVPNVNGMDGKKLSKRHGATAVGEYEKMGILPAALRNFLALLGWSPGADRELFFDLDEMIRAFSLDAIQPKSAAFDLKKLEWMNGQYLMHLPPDALLPVIAPLLTALGLDPSAVPPRRLAGIIGIAKQRSRTTTEAAKLAAVRLDARFIARDPTAMQSIARDPEAFRAAIAAAAERLHAVPEAAWEPAPLEQELRQLAESLGLAAGKLFQPIRVALTGLTATEPVHELLWAVGKADTMRRLRDAATWIPARV